MFLKLFVYATLGLLVALAARILLLFDFNKHVYNHRPGPCRPVEGIKYGAEDIELVKRLNSAFITSGLHYMSERSSSAKGQIFLYSFAQPHGEYEAKPLEIEGDFDMSEFHPHGISSYVSDGQILLYVINHDNQFKHSVEVFAYDERTTTLKHLKTIKDEHFIRPNNLIAVGKDKFILTNDGRAQSLLWSIVEAVIGLKTGSVIFYDGERSHPIIASHVTPSGVGIDRMRSHIFVASSVGRKLSVYTITKDYKSVELISEVDLYTSPDNIYVDETNAIWIGAHPIAKELAVHGNAPDDLQYTSPSQVIRVEFGNDFKTWKITEPYVNDGSELVASSVAVPYYQQLLIGSIFRTPLHCDIAHPDVL